MREPRWIANKRSRDRSESEHSAACWALESFRSSGEASDFPALRWWLFTHSFSNYRHWSLEGYRRPDVRPRLDQAEYDRMKAAYLQTEAGKADIWGIADGW
jgi:hypothetical protein